MTTVTQTIPTLTGGLSQQPDELKLPGQVNVAQNVLPDVTHGLLKRPGGKLVKSLSDGTLNSYDTGVWFHYYRDEAEQYIGQIIRRPSHADDGKIRMWKCSDGSEMNVKLGALDWVASTLYSVGDKVNNNNNIYICTTAGTSAGSGGPSGTGTSISDNTVVWDFVHADSTLTNYLQLAATDSDSDLQTLTLNDYTFITNRTKPVAMLTGTSDKEPVRPPEVFIELKQIKYASQYAVNLYDNDTTTPVKTATRISVERVKDSGNTCSNVDGSQASTYANYRTNAQNNSSYNARCDDSLGPVVTISGLAIQGDDALVPNVATKIFAITGGSQYTDEGDSIHVLEENSGSYSNFTNANKKDLIFRITTTGQSVASKVSNSADVSYQARYQTTYDLLHGGEGWEVGDEIYVWMKLALYKVTVEAVSETSVKANLGLIRPEPTPFDTETTVTAESILGSIKQEISNAFTVEQIGNGLYITKASGTFNASTPVGPLLNVVAGEVQTVEDLPQQCKHGFVVKVANSAADEDDYYLKFIGNNNKDGEGVWEECALPGTEIAFDNTTMPIQMVRTNATTFTVSHATWENAQVGDTAENGTNPRPSFVGKKINNILFFRNRLVFLSDENVIMSRPGDFFNFWNRSAMAFSNIDPIDLSCSSTYPATVFDGLPVNSGLVLFTKNQQFLLTTDSDILNPTTAKINTISTYNFNSNTNPISLGTTVGFLDNANKYSRFFEMNTILREGEPQIIEQSKPVSTSFAKDLNLVSNSRENSVIFFSSNTTNELYGFRYFTASNERKMQSWFTWKLTGTIRYHCMLDDALYVVLRNNNKDQLVKYTIKLDDQGFFVTDTDSEIYRINLDHSFSYTTPSNSYDKYTKKTTFTKPTGFESTNDIVIYDADSGADLGRYAQRVHSHVVPHTAMTNNSTFTYTNHGFTSGDKVLYHPQGGTPITSTASTWTDNIFYIKVVDANTFRLSSTAQNATSGGYFSSITGGNDLQTFTKFDELVFHGDWSNNTVILGYLYDMEVQFPTMYYATTTGNNYRSDTRGSLVIHRVKLNFGRSGVYKTKIERLGKDDYEEVKEVNHAGQYVESTLPFQDATQQTIPIYEKNKNVTLTVSSTHPSPATLHSLIWEGDYTNKYYKSV